MPKETDVGIARCPTGIPGLDNLLGGGFPKGRTILLKGECGTGKTIFCNQFLYNGIVKYNEPGILVLLEQNIKYVKRDMRSFGFNLDELEDSGKLVIIDASLSKFNIIGPSSKSKSGKSISLTSKDLLGTKEVVDIIIDAAKEIRAERVVIDSLPALDNLIRNKEHVRDVILYMNYRLQSRELTSILVSDILENRNSDIEDYVSDGVIKLSYITSGPDTGRNLIIQKMRGTTHSENIHPITFTEGVGMEILETED
ncbi:MAG: ATPase domain-containing protein [Candidatus Altiarchaeota archaeon]|nr:ATPase domain-containing protein [Candidatus Altiarchaeota archaeon]